MKSIIEHRFVQPEPNSGCWLWGGCRMRNGYGLIGYGGRNYLAHRLSWLFANGTLPDDLLVMHKCNNRACVNPDHLELGTHKDNAEYMVKCLRGSQGEKSHSARFTVKDVIAIRQRHAGGTSCYRMAREFGCEDETIRKIVLKRTWRHV
jgi:hypothetical protein